MNKIGADDAEAKSADIVAGNVAQLKAMFPEAVTEGKIDFDVLKQLLGGAIDEREEKYGLNWHGKRRARQLALTPSTGTLRPCPEESVDWDTTQNLMIEGDNLEVLKLLQKSYAGKVKLIYIDPPYNTGKDRVYSDDYIDGVTNYLMLTGQVQSDGRGLSTNTDSSGRFHTSWLSMLYPRLRVARDLLQTDGVILISIDDHELADLRCMLDEVFGEENFVATMIWEKGRKNDARLVSVGHEYLVVFAKSMAVLRDSKIRWREEKPGARDIWQTYLSLRETHRDDDAMIEHQLQAWYAALPKGHAAKKWSRYRRVDVNGPWRDRDISWPGGGGPTYEVVHPKTGLPCKVPEDGWRFSKPEEMARQIKAGLVEFRADHTEPPFRKAHIRPIAEEGDMDSADVELADDEGDEFAVQVRGTYFYKQSQVAVRHLRELLGPNVFGNPKDHVELSKLFDYMTSQDSSALFVDFFAGSGSSGEAVMRLNAVDGGQRRFILVQLPEALDSQNKDQKAAALFCKSLKRPQNIAEVTSERLRRAGSLVKSESPMFAGDTGFRVFKLASSNIQQWDPNRADLPGSLDAAVEHLKTDRTEADILYELLLKLGLDLCVPIEKREIAGKDVHAVGGGVLLACLTGTITKDDAEPLALGMVEWHAALAPAGETTCVFRDSAFADDVAKSNVAAILEQHGLTNVKSL
ncbi:MAG: site-specific DNA-methyltransferase [Acidobacteriota bacterium]|nr:site-specific DNA-methyltransferase [Acidobacteriota bacterium]